jgi:dTDP-N-acetylfucosamine:lipid II N-acetylfucosaminyltransferase
MKKIIHIHTDHKFVVGSERFYGDIFTNELIILGAKNSVNKHFHEKAQFFKPDPKNLNNILALVNAADILVVYQLDFFKSPIVNKVAKGVKIIWRFFGTELYSRKLHLYLSPNTRSFFKSQILKKHVKRVFPFLFREEKTFYKALRRVDAIACVFKEEYDYLKRHFNNLPRFIPLSLDGMHYANLIDFDLEYPKSNTLVIGNSRSYFNNHLDILELAEMCDLDDKLKIKLLFNYGTENTYTKEVRKKASSIENVSLIDSFIPPDEFINFYGPIAAFVNNSYRQLALGNIFLALYKGVKVYLNAKNPTYTWLKKEGLFIYEIEDLKKDLETGQIHLSKDEIIHNLKCFSRLKELYSKKDFQHCILELVYK